MAFMTFKDQQLLKKQVTKPSLKKSKQKQTEKNRLGCGIETP